jgi:alkylmercury lyase
MTTDYIERSTSLIGSVHSLELAPHAIRLLAKGEPVDLEQLAAASAWRVEEVDAALDAQTSAERDERGRLVGLALTLRPTLHRVTVDGRTLYAWCASDTLMFPVILGRPATVDSTCPHTRQPIHLQVTPEEVERLEPAGAVVSAVRPTGTPADVRAQTCHHGRFFSSPAAAARWRDEHPDGYVLSVDEAFRLDRKVITQLGWDAARAAGRRTGTLTT